MFVENQEITKDQISEFSEWANKNSQGYYLDGFIVKKLNLDNIRKKTEIAELKQKLLDTDYKAIKYAEGSFTEQEYETTKTARQQWRARIKELEQEVE